MNKIRYRLVFNRSHHTDQHGRALVQVEARQAGRKAYFTTNIYILKTQWDGGRVVSHPNASDLNAYLTEQIMTLEAVKLDLWKHGIAPTLDHLRQARKTGGKLTDFGVFARLIAATGGRKPRTAENLLGTVRKIERFRRVCVSEIDYAYLRDFEEWLRHEGLGNNSIAKQLTNVRTILSEAIRQGLVKDDPFAKYQKPKIIPREHVTLSETELRHIARVDVFPNVRDAFLFCCRTGLRFSDYKQLDDGCWQRIGTKLWLVINTQKTGMTVRLPMHLIGESLPHPPIGCNAEVNRQLKDIVTAAKIKKRVTFHTSRHTFATLMLNKGVPITTVQKLLGHTSVRMCQHYAETKDFRVEKDLKKAMKVDSQ